MTQTTFCDKNESHPLFHQSVLTQLNTVKLDFDQIRTMTCVFSGFRCSLLSLVLFVAIQALAKPENNANSTPVSSSSTKHCNNVYNSFYAGPNKKIETILQEIKKQLTQLQDDINISRGNKTTVKGKIRFFLLSFESCLFSKSTLFVVHLRLYETHYFCFISPFCPWSIKLKQLNNGQFHHRLLNRQELC